MGIALSAAVNFEANFAIILVSSSFETGHKDKGNTLECSLDNSSSYNRNIIEQ